MRARDCMALGCGASMRGSDLARHYRQKTDYKMISVVKKLSPSEAETELKAMGIHTAFMYKSGYHSSDKSPHWTTHKPTKQAAEGGGRGCPGGQDLQGLVQEVCQVRQRPRIERPLLQALPELADPVHIRGNF